LLDVGIKGKPHAFGNLSQYVPAATSPVDFREWVADQFDASVTWKDIEWLRSVWRGKLIIKGVLSAEDAKLAVKAGGEGVIVSNHGGRQLDGVASTISILPSVAEAVAGKAEVVVDGGIQSGLDVVRALALGADYAMIGRAWAYALAAGGEEGVNDRLSRIQRELHVAMALCGVTRVEDITPAIIEPLGK